MPDSEGNGWVTTAEAGKLLGLKHRPTIISMLRRLGVLEHRDGNRGGHPCSWQREQVEELGRERQIIREKTALGQRKCGTCKQWKDRKADFHGRFHLCKACRKLRDAERRQRYKRTFANRNPDRQPPGPVGLLVVVGTPPNMETAKKYACMMGFFQHRPLPIVDGKRASKREAFCSICTAPHCMHHPHLKPAAVRRMKRVPLRPAEDWA